MTTAFALSPEQDKFAAWVRETGRAELRPLVDEGRSGRVNRALVAALALQGLGAYPILQPGQPAQVDRWLPAVAAGDAVAAFALTEPEAGSEVQRTIIARELYR